MIERPFTLTPAALLARVEWAVKDRRQAFVEEYDLALAWADQHGGEPAVQTPGGDRLVRLGGDGTPELRDLCLAELAVARGEHVLSTRSLVADLLDLRHRLPRLWAQVQALAVEPWVARKIATTTRHLDRVAVRRVDAAVATAVAQSPGRLLALAESATIGADAAHRRQRLADAQASTGVWLTGTTRGAEDQPGLRGIYARLAAGDAVWVDATVQRVADRLAADPDLRRRHHPDLPDQPTNDQLRAAAFGWLARPGDLAELLGLLDQTDADRDRRRHQAVLYLHLDRSEVEGMDAVARAGLGPLLRDQVVALLGHTNVTMKPVIDLERCSAVDGYAHPEAVQERTLLRTTGSVFPHSSGGSARLDHDHPVPYDPLGPPGQTGDHNDAPLTRTEHRAKTHLGYTMEQLAPATYLWTTPHGLHRLVTRTGTHHVTDDDLPLLRRMHAA